MSGTDTTRVNKLIAHATGLSRREVDNAVSAGRVTLNGTTAVLGAQASPRDVIMLDGKTISATPYTYLLLHKPVGYVCSRRQQDETPTIYDLLEPSYKKLKAVGRLDKDSSGILLLTDDGDLAHTMTHPKFSKQKIYEIELDRDLEPLHQQMISDHGITLEDGQSQLMLERMSDDSRKAWRITMSEGRNRQIRRTLSALGYTVTKLHRTQFGPYSLADTAPGHTRLIDL